MSSYVFDPKHLDGRFINLETLDQGKFVFASTDPHGTSQIPNHSAIDCSPGGYAALLRAGINANDPRIRHSYKWVVHVLPGNDRSFLLEAHKFRGKFLSLSKSTHTTESQYRSAINFTDRRVNVEPITLIGTTPNLSNAQKMTLATSATYSRFRFYFLGKSQENLALCCHRSDDTHKHLVYAHRWVKPRNTASYILAKSASALTSEPTDFEKIYKDSSNMFRYRVYEPNNSLVGSITRLASSL